jgi:hypothetical protein
MRKLILFILSIAMLIGGLYLIGAEFLTATKVYFRFMIGGAVLVTLGAYLLWVDFAAPALGIKTGEE